MTTAEQITTLAQRNGTLTPAERGLLDVLLDRHVNTASDPAMRWFLYAQGSASKHAQRIPTSCRFPLRFKRTAGVDGTRHVTGSEDALLALYRAEQRWVCPACGTRTAQDRKTCEACKARRNDAPATSDRRLTLVLELRALHAARSLAACRLQRDGRLRNSLNIAATADFAHASHALETRYGDRFGWALSDTPAALKRLVAADAGCVLGCVRFHDPDLWVVACEASACGDAALLDELRVSHTRPKYEGIVLRAICHGGGPQHVQTALLKESYEVTGTPLFLTLDECRRLHDELHLRYRGLRWRSDLVRRQLAQNDGVLTSPAGCRRKFFGRPGDPATERDALAWGPRVLATHLVERTWSKCWHDPQNWPGGTVGEGDPVVRVLHSSPGTLLAQWPGERHDWALARWEEWCANTVEIAGTRITVPWSVGCGADWGEAERQRV